MRPKRLPEGILTTLLLAAIVPAAACGGNGVATPSSPTATPGADGHASAYDANSNPRGTRIN